MRFGREARAEVRREERTVKRINQRRIKSMLCRAYGAERRSFRFERIPGGHRISFRVKAGKRGPDAVPITIEGGPSLLDALNTDPACRVALKVI